jgi:NADPH:quinone reductase-like Zn-dependent oxidoreductase
VSQKMRCYCVTKHNEPLVAVDTETPTLEGTQVLVKVTRAGICHTDLHLWEGSYNLGGGKRLDISDRGIDLPLTLGHEIAGEVVAVGPDADASVVGTTCVVHPGVFASAVVGRDVENDEEIIAFVELAPGQSVTAQALAEFIAPRLTPYKRPQRIVILDALPLSPNAKILKHELKARAAKLPMTAVQ